MKKFKCYRSYHPDNAWSHIVFAVNMRQAKSMAYHEDKDLAGLSDYEVVGSFKFYEAQRLKSGDNLAPDSDKPSYLDGRDWKKLGICSGCGDDLHDGEECI